MFTTASETSTRTLTRLIKAMDAQHPATITYLKEEKDEAGKKTGALVETIRTIEIFDITTTKAGDILILAMDRETQERRSFRLDRIQAYTIHRTAYTVPRLVSSRTGLTHAVAALTPVHQLPAPVLADNRVELLAAILAA